MKKRFNLLLATLLATTTAVKAGGLLTNTNQNIAFNRNFAREGTIGIDGVYSNPAGVAFLSKGFHFSFNVQNVYQTRIIDSGIEIPALKGTPFQHPFRLNGAAENGVKRFVGEASVPFLPSIQAARNYDRWGFQAAFALYGGGGKATFNSGLASFERQIALLPALLSAANIVSDAPAYALNSYINGQQYIFGIQLGATYKVNQNLSAYAGMRFNYVFNKYEGKITDITANIDGTNQKLYDFFGAQSAVMSEKAKQYAAKAAASTDPALKAQLEGAAQQYAQASTQMTRLKDRVADKYLDCSQTGWGMTPIVGLNFNYKKWNVGTRLELNTNLNIENDTRTDDTGLFKKGVNTPNDIPGIWTLGVQYAILPNLRAMLGYHYFFDKQARIANDKQKLLEANTQEFLAGVELDITKNLLVSAGMQRTKYGLGDGAYLSDMSFVTSSYSVGFGASVRVARNARLNLAYFWTDYENFDKHYQQTYGIAEGKTIVAENTDRFTRTNKVLGAGIDIDF